MTLDQKPLLALAQSRHDGGEFSWTDTIPLAMWLAQDYMSHGGIATGCMCVKNNCWRL